MPGPEDDGAVLSKRGLEGTGDEAMEDGVGEEQNQPEGTMELG